MYSRLRPTMSERRPIGSSSELIVSAYAIITHWTVGRSAPNSFAILGSATATLPWSATDTNIPSPMAATTHRRYRREVCIRIAGLLVGQRQEYHSVLRIVVMSMHVKQPTTIAPAASLLVVSAAMLLAVVAMACGDDSMPAVPTPTTAYRRRISDTLSHTRCPRTGKAVAY